MDVFEETPLRFRVLRLLHQHLDIVLCFVVRYEGEVAVVEVANLVDRNSQLVLLLQDLLFLLAVFFGNLGGKGVTALSGE